LCAAWKNGKKEEYLQFAPDGQEGPAAAGCPGRRAMKRVVMGLGTVCGAVAVLALVHGGEAPAFKMTPEEAQLLELTNRERKKKELPLLRPSPLLFQLARAHSANMARQGKMEHVLDGKTPFERLRDAGYPVLKGAENIAACDTSDTLAGVVREWMSSKGHRENILSPEYTETGLGLAHEKGGRIYYTQVFAKPRE
jgi:uncharacterized protein YkwD